MPLIAVERGPEKGKTADLGNTVSEVVVGRDPGATLSITDTMSSRRHIRFFLNEKGNCLVEDLGSRNGTLLNGDKLEGQQSVTVGDKIEIGSTLISVLGKSDGVKKDKLVDKDIGGYKILERLGRGGMGTVYKANQLNLDRVVALKILSREWNDPGFVEKFRAEARAAGQLNHPNLIQVYDVGDVKVKKGTLNYFSMEYAADGSVQDLLNKRDKLPVNEALRIMIDAAKGLEYAEKKNLVHRDIKPDNLMISEDNMVKIGDLGLAQTTTDAPDEEGKESKIFGTPHFVSPEQIKGEKVDHRADLYSLGATFFRIISGRTPFVGSNVKEIIVKQVREQPPDVRELVPEIPLYIAKIIAKLLKKDPGERYQHATELIAELQEALDLGDVGRRASGISRLRQSGVHSHRIPRRRSISIVTAVAVIVVALVGIIVSNMMLKTDNGEPPENNVKNGNGANKDPSGSQAERTLNALLAKDRLDKKYRGKSATLDMASEYEALGKQYSGTEYGKQMLDKAAQLRQTFKDYRDRKAKELYDMAMGDLKTASGNLKALKSVLGKFEKIVAECSGTEEWQKAQEEIPKIQTKIGALDGQFSSYNTTREKVDPKIIQLARKKQYHDILTILLELKKAFTHADLIRQLDEDLRSYRSDAKHEKQEAIREAQAYQISNEFDKAIASLEVIYRIGIPEMVAEADRLKQQYQNERTAWILASEQRRLADDSEAYEKLLDRVQMHLSKYRINDALESFAGHQDKLETRLYQELYDGYAADLKQLKMLFEDRRDVFGQKIPYQLPPKLAALHKGYASNGHIVSLLSSRGSWKFGFRTKYGQFSATTTVGLALAEFPRNTILDWLAGDSQKPSHRIVAASIAAANIFGQFRWARRQIAVLEIRVATRGADSDLLSHAKKHRQAIEQHVAREWQRTVKARDIRKTYLAVPLPERKLSNEERRIVAEALVVSERLRKRYLEIFGYRQEVRADCRDWLRAKVNDSNKIKAISSFRSIRSLSQLQAKLKTIGITSPLTSKQRKKKGDQFLEYKGIALRMNETPMSEKEVVGEFIEAAKEMSR